MNVRDSVWCERMGRRILWRNRMPFERSLHSPVRPGRTGRARVLDDQAIKPAEKHIFDLRYFQNLSIFCLSILSAIGLHNSQRVAGRRQTRLLLKAAEFRKLTFLQLV